MVYVVWLIIEDIDEEKEIDGTNIHAEFITKFEDEEKANKLVKSIAETVRLIKEGL